jgi:hypothetical protein
MRESGEHRRADELIMVLWCISTAYLFLRSRLVAEYLLNQNPENIARDTVGAHDGAIRGGKLGLGDRSGARPVNARQA